MTKPKSEQVPDEALLKKRRTAGLIIQSALLLIAILAYLYLTAQSYIIDCKRDEAGMIICTLRTTVLGVVTLEKRTVTGMSAATVTDQCEGGNCKYRIELFDNQGIAYPVREQYTPNNIVKERVAKLLNQFVVTPTKTEINMREQTNWLAFVLPVTFIAAFVLYRVSLTKPGK